LRVFVAKPEYLFAMKCRAMRIGGVVPHSQRAVAIMKDLCGGPKSIPFCPPGPPTVAVYMSAISGSCHNRGHSGTAARAMNCLVQCSNVEWKKPCDQHSHPSLCFIGSSTSSPVPVAHHPLMQDTGLIRQFRPSAGHIKEVRP
jgi:hypothetical protein